MPDFISLDNISMIPADDGTATDELNLEQTSTHPDADENCKVD